MGDPGGHSRDNPARFRIVARNGGRMTSFAILGQGTALPSQSLTQDRAAELTSRYSGHDEQQAHRLSVLYRLTGIGRRHVAVLEQAAAFVDAGSARGPTTRWRMERYDEDVRPLARLAAGRALDQSGIEPKSITHLVTVSCTGFAAPGFDIALIRDLGLDPAVERTHVGFMGCHGALNGLRVARAFGSADPEARVLLCAAELCSLHFQLGAEADQAVANALFADGAAALVGGPAPSGSAGPWRVAASGSYLMAGTEDAMSWRIGDYGFEMTLSPRVSDLIRAHLRDWLASWLGRHDLGIADVASWAIHPGGPRILDAVEAALGLDAEATADSRAVLAECGNMSSPTILFILDRLRRRRAPRPCVAMGFGPGLTIEAALFV
jgi:predicted naringenin-chalcone synthase